MAQPALDDTGARAPCALPDEAVHVIVSRLPLRSLAALRLASRAWAGDVERCAPQLRAALPARGAAGCCRRHAAEQRRAALGALSARFGGAAALTIALRRGAGRDASTAPAAAVGLEPLAALPRLRSLRIEVEREDGSAGGSPVWQPANAWAAGQHQRGGCAGCAAGDDAAAAAAVDAGTSSSCAGGPTAGAQQHQHHQPDGCAFAGGLAALSRLTSLTLLGAGAYAPTPPAGPAAAEGAGAGPAARGAGRSALASELARLPLRRLDTDRLEELARPGGGATDLALLPGLRSLRLRVPLLASRSLWLDVASLPALTSLRVDVARAAAACGGRFHLRDALAPLGCLPGLRELRLGGFHSLCDRDLALAARLSALTSLHLRLCDGPFHGEEPLPGGRVTRDGAAALARGAPRLEFLGLAGAAASRAALAELLAALRALRGLDLSGVLEADDALLLSACGPPGGLPPRLASLRLARCPNVGDAGLAALAARCTGLERLDVSRDARAGGGRTVGAGIVGRGGGGGGVTDSGLAALAALPRLRELRLDGARGVTARGVAALAAGGGGAARGPPPLEVLSVCGCPGVCDAALGALGAALDGTLRVLRADDCPQITNRGLRRLLPLGALEELSLKGTLVEPRGPAWAALSARAARVACDPRAGLHAMGLDYD
ncbi:hypothetical protein Rsub_01058 [Raphidocelis subcapitata]|uniref:F-box domain-containing protein n=1 Tax=Raphidocelis subcapitata TaxID=307507 RepID=A0A2V0NLN8_9CHLO|nr:hypothetical protein Rsub_01058 [Raphidocelis subcapitata]|eukprot:GBF88346.1 hypothetical protein Rsub_01058 [Raphidocelis subcapitata]